MSRTGVEAKLPWQQVPKVVRQQVESALGAPVRRAARVWGGYSPTPSFRLALADGRRAFMKGTYRATNEFATAALHAEIRIYTELGALIGDWMPPFYGSFQHQDWHVVLLGDVGPKSAPPWTTATARNVARALAHFHQSSLGQPIPTWLEQPADYLPTEQWEQASVESDGLQQIAGLAPDATDEALAWLTMASPAITAMLNQPALRHEPYAILHGDLRSDNLRFARGRLYLFDWPAIVAGRPEWDIVVFAQTVAVEGGPAPEQILRWYADVAPVDAAAVDTAIAWWLTFFARRAWQTEIPGLPRLRRFQRQQLGVLLQWAARAWNLPEPVWAEELLK